eukprot:jgi/Picsp_1/523/NSC_00520-R1_---NA---
MKHVIEQIVFDAECAALYLCLIVSGWLALWVFGLRHLPPIQEVCFVDIDNADCTFIPLRSSRQVRKCIAISQSISESIDRIDISQGTNNVQLQAFGLKKPAKPLLSECQSQIESRKQEYRQKMASFGSS